MRQIASMFPSGSFRNKVFCENAILLHFFHSPLLTKLDRIHNKALDTCRKFENRTSKVTWFISPWTSHLLCFPHAIQPLDLPSFQYLPLSDTTTWRVCCKPGCARHRNEISGLPMRTVQTSHRTFSFRAIFNINFLLLHHWKPFPFFLIGFFFLLFVGKKHCCSLPSPKIKGPGNRTKFWATSRQKVRGFYITFMSHI